ncbi:hypothetical protein [Streptacidiphilus sp. MAP5-3]|uniref:hypothetical protein n=1 Tax=unclassified Streptacidiphilus TaxID=2643834 RepID=UPI003513C1B0
MRAEVSGRVSALPGAGDGADSWQIVSASQEVAERAAAVLGGAASSTDGGWRAVVPAELLPVALRREGGGVLVEIDALPGLLFALDSKPFPLWQIAPVRTLVALVPEREDQGVGCLLSARPLLIKTRGGRLVRYLMPQLATADVA